MSDPGFNVDGNYDSTYHLSPDEVMVATANALAAKLNRPAAGMLDDYYVYDLQDMGMISLPSLLLL